MKPDHRVLLGCALAWLCCAAVVVKSEDELQDGNAVKEGNSVGSEWPERDERVAINILKEMYRDLQEKPFYAETRDEGKEERGNCETVCNIEQGETSTDDIKCEDEDPNPITCTCLKEGKFHYGEKICKECECGTSSKSCHFDRNDNHKVCDCNEEYVQIGDECKRTSCKDTCNLPESATTGVSCDDATAEVKCLCDVEQNKFDGKSKTCRVCDCGTFSESCEFPEANEYKQTCGCQTGYVQIGDKCRSTSCRDTCNLPESAKTGVICDDATAEVKCSCDVEEKKFDGKSKTCRECKCGLHAICSFEDGQQKCECEQGYEKTTDGKCKIPDSLCKTNCGDAAGVICDPKSTLNEVVCSCDDSQKRYNITTKVCRETCDSNEKCQNGGNCTAVEKDSKDKYCECLEGTSGDLCSRIDECFELSLIKCIGKNGVCKYNVTEQKAFCHCEEKHSFDDTIGYCETCDCGENAKDCFFVKGELHCKCKEKFEEKNKKCERCDCGDGAKSCHFDSEGKKICDCKEKHKEDEGTCKLCDCGERSKSCKFKEGKKVCECDDGFEGITGTCKAAPICIETCGEIDKEFTCIHNDSHAYCKCPVPKLFDYAIKRCRIVCGGEKSCENGANCTEDKVNKDNKFCSCLPGTSGDACDVVDDCVDGGKYENCTEGKGDCSYNTTTNKAECKCEGIKKLKDLGGYCEDCDCGTNSDNCSFKGDEKDCKCKVNFKDNNGTCQECVCGDNSTNCEFENGKKKCSCEQGFADNDGTCKECDCGPNSNECSFVEGKKTCKCKEKFSEKNGTCEACYCGVNEDSCSFENEKKICKCKEHFSDNSGECKACDCGKNSTKCSFNETGEIVCVCTKDFAQKHHKCEECKCGKFTEPCRFKNDEQICDCTVGYGKKGDNCTACQCGEHSIGCDFEGENKICICKEGYGNNGGLCKVNNCIKKCGKPHDEVKCEGDPFGELEDIKCTCIEDDLEFDYYYKEKKCRLTCSGDQCQNGATCGTRYGHQFCFCLEGTRGDYCDKVIECQKGGKFEKCSGGDRGTCSWDMDHSRPKCGCPEGRQLDIKAGYCQKKCQKEDECKAEGKICHPKGYCACEDGKEGDTCETVTGCTDKLKLKCKNANAECVFDKDATNRATCKCNSENYSFDGEKGQCISKFCKNIGCNGAKCNFEDGTNTGYCKCDKGFYNYKSGKCEEPDKCLLKKTPCKENFVCVKGECKCNHKIDGDKCIQTFCDGKSCFTGGQCVNPEVQSYTCTCKDKHFYTGSECKDTKCILKEFQKECPCPREMERKENKCVPKGNSKSCDKACGYGYCVDDKCLCVSLSKNVNGTCILDASKVCATKKLTKDFSKCECDGKYKQAKDGITCELITCSDDEAKKTCDAMGATCKMSWTGNSPGYYCTCPDGYVGDKEKNICTDPCSNIDISEQCIGMDHFCYNSYSDERKRKGDCVCPPPLAADVSGRCVKIAKYVYLMSNIPVIKKKYEMKQDIDHVRLNAHLIQSISQTFSEDIFDYGHLYDYEVKGSVVYSSVWIRFKKDPTIELKRYNFQAQKFPKETCEDCDDSLYVWPPSLLLSQEHVAKVQFKNLSMCSPELKNKLCGVEAACNENKCYCPKGFKPLEYSIRNIAPGIRILRCETDKKGDLDECKLGTHTCSENTTCVKVTGDYICACKQGFKKSTVNDKEPCTDLCTPSPCKQGTCEMKDKLFNCICPKGYEGSVCDQKDDSLASAKNSTVIVGAVLGSLLAVLLIALFLMYRKMRESSYSEDFTPAPRQDHAAEMMERRPMRGHVNKSYE